MSVAEAPPGTEHLDVLIVGAGISGIGAAYYLGRDHPQRTCAVLEARAALGGTWDLFRYPGVRSDSDLHTFGYAFKPWEEEAIAGGDRIRAYLREAAEENGIDAKVRYHHSVRSAAWSSAEARWTVVAERTDTGETITLTCGWLFCGGGYYRYDEGYTPRFAGLERFTGTVVHPQHWPQDLDYRGKRVVVVGSGATAVTLVPAMAGTAGHVTMLQRTPTYILPVPSTDRVARVLRTLLGARRGYEWTRRKNIAKQAVVWRFAQRRPAVARRLIRWANTRQLPTGFPVDEHFNPPYEPWDQRLCAVPDGDLFRALRNGSASVVTDRIGSFTEHGIRLASGRELEADLVVTATGLNVQAVGGIRLSVDGTPVHLPDTIAFKGVMLSGVPNFALSIGYTNSSWTLKVDLLCEHWCRLLAYMDDHGHTSCRPEPSDPGMPTRPLLDFGAGYVRRALDQLPRQGTEAPWLMSMSYRADVRMLREQPVQHPDLHFGSAKENP